MKHTRIWTGKHCLSSPSFPHNPTEFWSSLSDTQNGPGDLKAPPTIKASPITAKAPPTSAMQVKAGLSQDLCYLLSCGRQESLCFINPLFLQVEVIPKHIHWWGENDF